jgi:hypothetical protein
MSSDEDDWRYESRQRVWIWCFIFEYGKCIYLQKNLLNLLRTLCLSVQGKETTRPSRAWFENNSEGLANTNEIGKSSSGEMEWKSRFFWGFKIIVSVNSELKEHKPNQYKVCNLQGGQLYHYWCWWKADDSHVDECIHIDIDRETYSKQNWRFLPSSSHIKCMHSLPMQSKIQPTVPSPPHANTRKSGTSRKKFNLKNKYVKERDWYFKVSIFSLFFFLEFYQWSTFYFMENVKYSNDILHTILTYFIIIYSRFRTLKYL